MSTKITVRLLTFLGIWFLSFCVIGMVFIVFEYLFKGAEKVIVTPKIMRVFIAAGLFWAIIFFINILKTGDKRKKQIKELIEHP